MESQLLSNKYILQQPRWDFRYFDPEYLEVEKLLDTGKYPVEPLASHVRQIVNFGAYSLCNLLVWVDDGIPYLRVTDLREDGIVWAGVPRIPPEVHTQLPKSKVYPHDVLYSMAGTIGLAVVAPEDLGECNSNQAIAQIRLKDSLDPHYLATFLNSRLGRYQSERIANGQTVLNINMGEICKLRIPLPPRPIQDRIAQVMQDAYATQQEKLAEVENLFKTMDAWAFELLGVSFTSFVPPHFFTVSARNVAENRWDVSYHRPLNPVFADDNIWCSFEQYAKTVRDTFTPSKRAIQMYYYVGIQNMSDDPYSTDDNALTLSGDQINGLRKRFHGGDILLARLGPTLGNKKSAIVPKDVDVGCCSPEFLVIRPKDSADCRFLLWVVKANLLVEQMLTKTRGATPSRARLYADDLLKLRVPKASPSQQKTIGQELERRRAEAKRLRTEAETVVAEAKARVERMILEQEEVS